MRDNTVVKSRVSSILTRLRRTLYQRLKEGNLLEHTYLFEYIVDFTNIYFTYFKMGVGVKVKLYTL